jgi:ubiquinone/menaquinone biosynthesis C-methylase UbiE
MPFFRHSSLEDLPVSIAGIKLGDRLLVAGCGDARLIARLAVKTGLTGRACAIDEQEARASRAAAIATREGALVEHFAAPWTMLPLDAASFDVAILRDVLATLDATRRSGALSEILRVLRPGGRCLVIDGGRRGWFGVRGSRSGYDPRGTLDAAGFKAARIVAERDGMSYVEGVKENTPG